MRYEVFQNCTLYHGNSIEVLELLTAVDAVVTDPPYGVGLGEVINGQAIEKKQTAYESFEDTEENIKNSILPIFHRLIDKFGRVVATTGNRNMWLYPKPDDFGVWYNPAGTGRGKWGFNLVVTPILYWGKDPRAGKGSTPSSCWGKADSVANIKNISHPCPKPLKFTKWLVGKASLEGQTVYDPFMGSGTTGVACIDTGRKFIGSEIELKYFDFACKRIEERCKQKDMFHDVA